MVGYASLYQRSAHGLQHPARKRHHRDPKLQGFIIAGKVALGNEMFDVQASYGSEDYSLSGLVDRERLSLLPPEMSSRWESKIIESEDHYSFGAHLAFLSQGLKAFNWGLTSTVR